MIRMGRSSKTETPSEAPNSYEQPKTSYNYQTSESSNRALSESESMARDIKEGRLSGFVGSGTMLTGETSFQAMLRVDGHLTGRVMSEAGTLIIGSTGRVDANIQVGTAMINGTVNGDIVATEKIELGRSARVIGNVQTPRLTIEDGAIFEGSCAMLKSRETSDKRAHEAQRAVSYAETTEQIEYPDAEEKIEAAAS
jgi:cytoskeletal protein CcmA (bactofilin family)